MMIDICFSVKYVVYFFSIYLFIFFFFFFTKENGSGGLWQKWFLMKGKPMFHLHFRWSATKTTNGTEHHWPKLKVGTWLLEADKYNSTRNQNKFIITTSHWQVLTPQKPHKNVLWLFTHFSAKRKKNTNKNGNVMRHEELDKYCISFMISDSSNKPSKMYATDNKHNVEKNNDSELWPHYIFNVTQFSTHTEFYFFIF